jgi:cytochrome P450
MAAVPDTAEARLASLIAAWGLFLRVATNARDPYPALAEARRATPVLREYANGRTSVLVFRHDDVGDVLRDASTFSSSILSEGLGPSGGDRIVVSMDDSDHRRHRALISHAFRAKALASWEETVLPELAHRLIDEFADDGAAELVSQFTFDYPAQVIAAILGLPPADFSRFQRWTVAVIDQSTDPAGALAALQELRAYLVDIVADRRAQPRHDLISDLIQAEIGGERLTDDDIYAFVRMLLPAGVETTYRSLGNTLFLLLTNRDVLKAVRADRSLLGPVIEETLRVEVPMLITSRVAAVDTELRGVEIPSGASVTAVIGAANRDEERWSEPDRFHPFRDPAPHISFGFGAHLCLGMHLARAEARAAIGALLERLPRLRPTAGQDAHIHGQVFRSPTSLPVKF